jgi:hypothetical protein
MEASRWRKSLLIAGAAIALIAAAVATWLFQEVEYLRIDSPDGKYTAIVTYRRYESLRPTFPGQSGDKEGFIRIENQNGLNYGKIGVPTIGMSRDLEWTDNGADLKLVCEWDFAKREYRFWNKSQTETIVKRIR